MLYILPPTIVPSPPSPWNAIVCGKEQQNINNNKKLIFKNQQQQINSTRINYARPAPRRSRYRALFKFKNRFDSAGLDEDESVKSCKSLSECYFAGKGTALVLGQNESIRTLSDGTRLNITPNNVSSSNTTETNTCGSDIQQHLQSMFYLLRPEETLKMAVKLESIRAGRTRYLVVVSRTEKNIIEQTTDNAQSIPGNLEATTDLTAVTTKLTASAQTTCPIKEDKSCSYSDKLNNISISSTNNDSPIFYLNNDDNMINTTNIHNTEHLQLFSNYCCDGDNDNIKNKTKFSSANLVYPTTSEYINSDDFCKNSYITSVKGSEREESCLLGIDCNEKTTVGLVLRILADTTIRLDGDGGFSVSVCGRTHIFKPVSVQAMWSALQTLHKVSSKAREQNYYPGGPSHDWVSYYERHIESDRSCLNEWHAMDSLESRRPPSPDTIRNKPTEREETERVIRTTLKEIMMVVDLDEVTSKYIRSRLEEHLDMDLAEFKSFIDQEMLTILGQMDAPTEVFDHVYLGSEWNASNLEELQKNGVHHILNVTREIDNFFPGMFDYCNVRVYDDEKTDLLKHWDNTFKYITRAKINGSKVLVHCKMGVSRSASVVIAYAMKAYNWDFSQALKHVKEKRSCIKPNKSFITQLETYQGMLDAMKNKEKLQRSKSETNLKSPKDARLLPGSEPTPLIQALNVGKANLLNISGKDLRKIGNRPKSWSPDNVETSQVMLSKPQSQSLEHLCPQQEEKEAKNIRLPCSNGQNYSVSQNQAVHLQEESQMPIPSVKLIISELESNERRIKYDKKNFNLHLVQINNDESDEVRKEIWDPGENINIINQINNVNNTSSQNVNDNDINQCSKSIRCDSPVWTSSAQIIHQTPIVSLSISETKDNLTSTISSLTPTTTSILKNSTASAIIINNHKERKDGDLFSSQLDRVFDREERKQNQISIIPPIPITISELIAPSTIVSRQTSWSSVDSAVVLVDNRDTPSRHSSWGSGDNRTIPSRNSSWGSYDMRHHCGVPQKNNKLMKDDAIMIRTSNSGIFAYDKDEIPWHPGTVKRTKQKIEELSVSKNLCSETNDENKPVNGSSKIIPKEIDCSLIEMCYNKPTLPSNIQQARSNSEEILVGTTSLSSSYYSRLSASAPETSAINFIEGNNNTATRRCNFISRFSVDGFDKKKDDSEFQGAAGIVRNLKMNFEAKAIAKNSDNSKGRSLPSSPVAVHADLNLDKFPADIKDDSNDVINVKGLVDKYEVTKMRINTTAPLKQRPRSVFETKQIQLQTQPLSKPLMLNHSKIITAKAEETRRPPVSPTVKNAVGNIPICNNNNNNNNNSNITTKTVNKKVQQHGKTHPLARLGLPKQRLNTAAYNTM